MGNGMDAKPNKAFSLTIMKPDDEIMQAAVELIESKKADTMGDIFMAGVLSYQPTIPASGASTLEPPVDESNSPVQK
jgi:hypothetical protein